MKTVNEMRTPDNLDSPTPQEFGNSWTAAEVNFNFVKQRKVTLKLEHNDTTEQRKQRDTLF